MSSKNPSIHSGRALLRIGALLLSLLCLGAIAFLWMNGRSPLPPTDTENPSSVAENQPAPQDEAQPLAAPERSDGGSTLNPQRSTLNAQPSTAARAPSSPPRVALPEPTPLSRQLVGSLSQANGPLTPERVAEWKTNLLQLVQQGATGVPAIREFLDKNTDFE